MTFRLKAICLLALLFVGASLQADSIEGEIKLVYADSMFAKDTFKKEFGKTPSQFLHELKK